MQDIYNMEQWEKDESFKAREGQQITEEIYNTFFNMLPPIFIPCYTYGNYTDIFLCSEPVDHAPDSKGIFRAKYNAFGKQGDKFYYIGERFPENILNRFKNKKKNSVFNVTMDWASEDAEDVQTESFSDYKTAKEYFNKLIQEEIDNSWIHDCITDGSPDDGYILDKTEGNEETGGDLWDFYQNSFYSSKHTTIRIEKKEVH